MADSGLFFTVMPFAPDTNDSDGQFVRKIKLRDTSFLSKRQLFICQKLTSMRLHLNCKLKLNIKKNGLLYFSQGGI